MRMDSSSKRLEGCHSNEIFENVKECLEDVSEFQRTGLPNFIHSDRFSDKMHKAISLADNSNDPPRHASPFSYLRP